MAKRSIVSLVGASVLLAGITTWFNRDNVGGLIEDVRVLRSPMTDQEEDISALVSKVGAEFGETNPGRPRVKCVGDSISGDVMGLLTRTLLLLVTQAKPRMVLVTRPGTFSATLLSPVLLSFL